MLSIARMKKLDLLVRGLKRAQDFDPLQARDFWDGGIGSVAEEGQAQKSVELRI